MEEAELRKILLDYMDGCSSLSLATEKDGRPWSASLFFVNIGFEIYFLSSPSSRHGENILVNPEVSATINPDYSKWQDIKGIQLEGRAEKIGGIIENPKIVAAYLRKFPDVTDFLKSPLKMGAAVSTKVAKVAFYRLKPRKMFFVNNSLGFGHRDELEFEI